MISKNSTYAYTYIVSLAIKHPTKELSYLAEELRKVPNSEVGKRIGKGYEKISYEEIKTSDLGFELDGGWHNALLGQDLPGTLEKVLTAILPYKDLLLELTRDGGEIRCNVGWFMNSHVGTSFSPRLLQSFADLKISLNISIYMNEEQENKYISQIDHISERIRDVLHKHDPSKIIENGASLSELHLDPYQDMFNLLPHLIKAKVSEKILENELREELSYFDRTNTPSLKSFKDYDLMATELLKTEL